MMNFSKQVKFSLKWSAVLGVPSWILVIYGALEEASTGVLPWPIQMYVVVLLFAFSSFVLFVFGGLFRPLHRWVWFRFGKNSINLYTGRRNDEDVLGLFKIWVGDTKKFEDQP